MILFLILIMFVIYLYHCHLVPLQVLEKKTKILLQAKSKVWVQNFSPLYLSILS